MHPRPVIVGGLLCLAGASLWVGLTRSSETGDATLPPRPGLQPTGAERSLRLEGSGHAASAESAEREALLRGDLDARRAALRTLATRTGSEDETASALLLALADGDAEVRAQARAALARLGAAAVSVLLAEGLTSPDVELPLLAVELLGELAAQGVGDVGAIERALLRVLNDGTQRRALRERAAAALARRAPVEAEVLEALVRATQDASDEVAQSAIEGLGRMRGVRGAVLSAVLAALSPGRRQAVTEEALEALERLEAGPDEVLPALFELAREDRGRPASLAQYGREALPWIERLLREDAQGARRFALTALGCLGAEGASLAALVLDVARKHEGLRWLALRTLVEIRADARPLIPELETWLRLPGVAEDAGQQILWLLAQVEPEGQQALVRALSAPEREVRACALEALVEWMPEHPGTRPALVLRAREESDPELQRALAEALARLEDRPPR